MIALMCFCQTRVITRLHFTLCTSADYQTDNFRGRAWEAQLPAAFSEQRLLVRLALIALSETPLRDEKLHDPTRRTAV
jgi:hypothetical protein